MFRYIANSVQVSSREGPVAAPFRLLDLPRELRDSIYEFWLEDLLQGRYWCPQWADEHLGVRRIRMTADKPVGWIVLPGVTSDLIRYEASSAPTSETRFFITWDVEEFLQVSHQVKEEAREIILQSFKLHFVN